MDLAMKISATTLFDEAAGSYHEVNSSVKADITMVGQGEAAQQPIKMVMAMEGHTIRTK
jgi:hypothetical protein